MYKAVTLATAYEDVDILWLGFAVPHTDMSRVDRKVL